MLIFVLATEQTPSMEDTYAVLNRAIVMYRQPDRVIVLDPKDNTVFSLQEGGVAVQILDRCEVPLELEKELEREYKTHFYFFFIIDGNRTRSCDDVLKDEYRKFHPYSFKQLTAVCEVDRSDGGRFIYDTILGYKL